MKVFRIFLSKFESSAAFGGVTPTSTVRDTAPRRLAAGLCEQHKAAGRIKVSREVKAMKQYVAFITTDGPSHETRKYTISMDSSLMARIDGVTKNRSAFLAKAAAEFLGEQAGVSG
jgi:hypothetical protein